MSVAPVEPSPGAAVGAVTAVCVTFAVVPASQRLGASGIDKRPVDGPVAVGPLGLTGDVIVDRRHHGGPDQALYAYSDEDADFWTSELERDIPPGTFGENLRIVGVSASDALIGEQWQLGEPGIGPVVEVTSPRTPCAKFARTMGDPRWVLRFTRVGRTGTYLRVVGPGRVAAGDPIAVVRRPEHGISVRRWFTEHHPGDAVTLLGLHDSGELRLQPALLDELDRVASRARRAAGA
jgi:MOSC domain-containing protein YiiM